MELHVRKAGMSAPCACTSVRTLMSAEMLGALETKWLVKLTAMNEN
jgi:hypothetical protein